MIKLYKRVGGELRYWEAWESDREITIHWGVVGDRGEDRTVPLKPKQRAATVIKEQSAPQLADGFAEVDEDDLDEIIVQYQIVGFGTAEDLDRRVAIENYLNGEIGWLGAGHLDGGDIGSGTINIFLYVVHAGIVGPCVIELLRKGSFLDGATVAVRKSKSEDLRVIWPSDHSGEFSY